MKIEVIGSGCKKCKALFELTKEVVQKLGITDTVEYSTDITKIAAMGVMSSPVLAIEGKPVLVGVLPDEEKLKQIITGNLTDSKQKDKNCSSCKCGGNC
ncbi:MAG: thioredoxin family protein [Proteobacteria bacterium]|nr:thioredoxin family protein [Pseudomonadota bacterium]